LSYASRHARRPRDHLADAVVLGLIGAIVVAIGWYPPLWRDPPLRVAVAFGLVVSALLCLTGAALAGVALHRGHANRRAWIAIVVNVVPLMGLAAWWLAGRG
jgi:hypothetical protein